MKKSKLLEPGQRFGRLTVISLDHVKKLTRKDGETDNIEHYKCQCDCGKQVVVQKGSLKSGHTKSCGCFCKEQYLKANTKHGMSENKLYDVWINLKMRCLNPTNPTYKHYGGRGICFCKEWEHDFMSFYNWSMQNGYREGLEIDRIDNNGNYEPKNCRWANRKQQMRNTRKTKLITFEGKTMCALDWSKLTGIPRNTLLYRLSKKWPAELILKYKKYKKGEVKV